MTGKVSLLSVACAVGVAAFLGAVLIFIGVPRFDAVYSTSVYSADGMLLGARIAGDGQWRFPPSDSIPHKYEKCLLMFEDEYFYYHPGVNPISATRAMYHNVKHGRVVSGGSTVTMQIQRMYRRGGRHIWNKVVESAGAIGMELVYSKDEILNIYAAHAPFGGNVVGLEAAAWRYFGRPPHQLSWSETALLAVLPNSPSLIHPGKNRDVLLIKRNRLLHKLKEKRVIDDSDYRLALDEPLPDGPVALPDVTPHLTDRMMKEHGGQKVVTTIDYHLQQQCNIIADRYSSLFQQSEIHNIGLVVARTGSGDVIAYVGNSSGTGSGKGHKVDMVTALRSTGSLLKPFLFIGALQDGLILPNMLLPDIPTYYSDYKPENYSRTFDGAVAAGQALSRSLNIPAVRLLHEYGVEKFLGSLHAVGLKELSKPASHYGLSLILGGAESSLWSLTGSYASVARCLNSAVSTVAAANPLAVHPLSVVASDDSCIPARCRYDVAAIWHVVEALSGGNRPDDEVGWQQFAGGRKIAWKTGTSFGFRDAWSIGITPEYAVGVWVGNATGEGRPGIVGGQAAAPVMFELFRLLPPTNWFDEPFDAMTPVEVCRQSGFLAGSNCPDIDTLFVPHGGASGAVCRWHRIVHLSADSSFRVSGNCYPPERMAICPWFVLPPVYEHYFKNKHPWYKPLPVVMAGCEDKADNPLDIVYPPENASVFLGVGFDRELQPLVVTATHRNSNSKLFWHLDDSFIGTTSVFHQKEIVTYRGFHTITVVDEAGNSVVRRFRCIGRGE